MYFNFMLFLLILSVFYFLKIDPIVVITELMSGVTIPLDKLFLTALILIVWIILGQVPKIIGRKTYHQKIKHWG